MVAMALERIRRVVGMIFRCGCDGEAPLEPNQLILGVWAGAISGSKVMPLKRFFWCTLGFGGDRPSALCFIGVHRCSSVDKKWLPLGLAMNYQMPQMVLLPQEFTNTH